MDNLSDRKVCDLVTLALTGNINAQALLRIWTAFGVHEPTAEERDTGKEVE